jgi:hypothetical protein
LGGTSTIITTSQHLLSPKNLIAPTKHVFFLGKNTFHTQFKIPKNIPHELPHNHSTNPKHIHPLLCVGPYRNTCNNSRPFPDILNTMKVFLSWLFQSSPFNQFLFLYIYNTPKSKSHHTFQYYKKSSNLVFFHHWRTSFSLPQPT